MWSKIYKAWDILIGTAAESRGRFIDSFFGISIAVYVIIEIASLQALKPVI